ncbi:CPBP family intramembrane glutamic endopeptidase [Thiorhodovibrio winogradskyi]|uniref:CPBP family intramembrane glutamic endopeptidase n=1 Tax=Thiorhodovibrio winogradskyi TaxID=77007 RepID=UPI003D356E72|nr:hypothetical protein [Thiorhodovibrio winogradskyi]
MTAFLKAFCHPICPGARDHPFTSSLFGLFHLHFGFAAVILTLVSSVVFGLFYLRNRNLAGVTLFHFIAGGCAFWFGLL